MSCSGLTFPRNRREGRLGGGFYHSQVLSGLDVPAAVSANVDVGVKPVDVKSLVDLNATQLGVQSLPAISEELLTDLMQTWKDIECVWGSSGVAIEDMVSDAFGGNKSRRMRSGGRAIVELDEAAARYNSAFSRHERWLPGT